MENETYSISQHNLVKNKYGVSMVTIRLLDKAIENQTNWYLAVKNGDKELQSKVNYAHDMYKSLLDEQLHFSNNMELDQIIITLSDDFRNIEYKNFDEQKKECYTEALRDFLYNIKDLRSQRNENIRSK